jgi:hypothetical protein
VFVMSDPSDPDTLEQLRVLLRCLEQFPSYDTSNTAFVKRVIRTRIRALEAAQSLASETWENAMQRLIPPL